MWEPIASADTSRECWSTVAEIARALSEEDAAHTDPGINGDAGIALFLSYLDAADANASTSDRAFELLGRSTGALANRRLLPSLYSGFFGIGWVVTHLTRELFEGDADLTEIDDALDRLLYEQEERPPFELVGGLAGFGTYLVERLPHPRAAELLRRVVDRLDESRDESGAWYTSADWMPEWQRELMPSGSWNLGVAHGIPGVIGFLAAAWREGFRDERLPRLAGDAVRWILERKDPAGRSSVFPSHLTSDGDPRPTRTAWCYGDLGVAAVLLSAAQGFGRTDWRDEALAIARIAARRTAEETLTMDVGLCHGAIGLAHLFNRIHQATRDGEMRDAALAWYQRSLAMRRPGEGIAGFLTWVQNPPRPGEWKAETGFLGGVAGIGLALLAAVTDIEPVWDRVMLVAVPPRNGDHLQ